MLLAVAAACRLAPPAPAGPGVPASSPGAAPAPAHLGVPYDIDASASLLTIVVYRGGTLASMGHNHVIASHDLAGSCYVPPDEVLRTSCEIRVSVDTLSIDEPALRAAQSAPDFPPDVPESARQGTRRNMLGAGLLDAAHFPQIVLRTAALRPGAAGGAVLAEVRAGVRGEEHAFTVPFTHELAADALTVSADTALRQSELGLTPFSAMLGALQVQDEMRVRLHLVAHPAATAH